MKLIYAGSVKNLYLADDPTQLWFEYTDDYSVFDWGKMPDQISGKGEALAGLADWFFRTLADEAQWKRFGLTGPPIRHHLIAREANRIRVTRVDVPKIPTINVGGGLVYDYGYDRLETQLIPLEVIFRFGVPKGSSLLSRKNWYPFPIEEGAEFEQPLIEFSTKLESKDRFLPYQEAAQIAQGGAATLNLIHAATDSVAKFLKALFEVHGLKLWDGKLEWALIQGELALVDSIGPDELRVGLGNAVFSKQFLRDYYVGSEWYQAVHDAKRLAKERGKTDWKRIVRDELNVAPSPLSKPYLEAAEALYADFHSILVSNQPSNRFIEALALL